MTRRYLDAFLTHREAETVISCLWVITGFNQRPHIVKKNAKGSTAYGYFKKLSHSVNAITSFSAAPLRMIFFCGILIFLTAICYALFLSISHFMMAAAVDGWTSIMVSIWILGGMIISFIGIIGIYLAKIFSEVKQRPYTIVRGRYGRSD